MSEKILNNDTKELLKECNSGIQMGVSAIEELLPSVKNHSLKEIIERNHRKHMELGNETHKILNENNLPNDEPNPMAKTMSWIKINTKYAFNSTDSEIANLLMDGCNMGVKSINKYLNQYENAENNAKDLAIRLADIEEKLSVDLRPYL